MEETKKTKKSIRKIRRIRPFDKTLALGIFITSIFVWVIGVVEEIFIEGGRNSLVGSTIGTMVYYNFALLVSIISGLISGNKGVLSERRKRRK